MSLTPAVQQLLNTLTPEEINTVLSKLTVPRSIMKVHDRAARGKSKKTVRVAPVVKINTRPLNSFIAFRSYYSSMFANFQQKQISGFVTSMWREDPFKAKWSIIAKSYSMVRDTKGKDHAPLNAFLAINGPLMDIIEPAQYLQTMGWNIAVAEDGQAILLRTATAINERSFTTNLSVNDLIRHSYQQGYFTGNLFDVLQSENEASMTMASSVQPITFSQATLIPNANDDDLDIVPQHDVKGLDGEEEVLGKMESVEDSTGELDLEPNDNIAVPETLNASALSAENYHLDGEWPYDVEFAPEAAASFTFDPYWGSQFDVFEMSGASWADLSDLNASI
ncbi:hypothetical protein N7G274_003987 [Stereocaulon virgatum]|uniref:Alpha box domain-containing protein n=1 Tax=Stereocaulon virgatum TaxID=373712 RepID=A0ABR4AAM5_9LECA